MQNDDPTRHEGRLPSLGAVCLSSLIYFGLSLVHFGLSLVILTQLEAGGVSPNHTQQPAWERSAVDCERCSDRLLWDIRNQHDCHAE